MQLAVKVFKRSSAGTTVTAADLRTPQALVAAVSYLFDTILDADAVCRVAASVRGGVLVCGPVQPFASAGAGAVLMLSTLQAGPDPRFLGSTAPVLLDDAAGGADEDREPSASPRETRDEVGEGDATSAQLEGNISTAAAAAAAAAATAVSVPLPSGESISVRQKKKVWLAERAAGVSTRSHARRGAPAPCPTDQWRL